jgi:hypothetical protein
MVGIWTIWAYSQPVSGIELCYAVNGKVMANYNVTACEPETAIRRCCSRADLCADNGLCLNAGGDNLWTIQGCTDWFWGAPFHKFCDASFTDNATDSQYVFVHLCGRGTPATLGYCCGQRDDLSCCEDPSVIFQLPIFHNAPYHPGEQPSAAGGSRYDQSDRINLGIGIRFGLATLLVGIWQVWETHKARKRRKKLR